jgi:hypothetical protein
MSETTASQVLRVPFALTRAVRAPHLRRVRARDVDGVPAWTFDLVTNVRRFADGDSVADNYSAAVVALPRRVDGRVSISRRGFLRSPVPLAAPEVEAGTDALRRKFRVRSSSAQLAQALLDDEELCAWLAGPGSSYHYEIAHDRVLAYGWRRYLGGRGPLRAATAFAQRIGS